MLNHHPVILLWCVASRESMQDLLGNAPGIFPVHFKIDSSDFKILYSCELHS